MEIKVDDLTGDAIQELIMDHLRNMEMHSPAESRHALDLEGLRKPEVTLWSAWDGGELVGCGALKELDSRHGEIKSMKTSPIHLRKGVSRGLLLYIIDEAKKRGYIRLSLETGSMIAFEPARNLYEGFGFHYCGPFGDYIEDPNSLFMTKEL
ncbi:GNAT family N-acetyltransferase [Rossellomorea vietnamensis]|uniref:GNAT family N-acetyltransferase n=1 Tax=Rossellomorea vietnamensis TaxID=218284 RepID=A0A5D4NRW7_9BACI|nr:GNAT family N-acetyltransferase [Rossellomorea vietnamensis]TYS16917.1 GNAT family N-acetyltransferase [Rossellomorea vietnamensis]